MSDKVLIIRSSEWFRGDMVWSPSSVNYGNEDHIKPGCVNNSQLLDPSSGRMCCLGIHAEQAGWPKVDLQGVAEPGGLPVDDVGSDVLARYPWLCEDRGEVWEASDASVAMKINDDYKTTDDEKIAALRPLFAEQGWQIDWRPDE